jgi:hypothetical protein
MTVIRSFADVKAVTAMLRAEHPVLVVMQASADEQQRVLDLLSGWALGSGGNLDRIGQNTVLARPADSPPVLLGRSGVASAVEEVFASEGSRPLSRDEEERLLPQAIAGSISARRRIIDSYAELATLFALKIRPRSVPEARAVQIAQDELDRLVTFPSKGSLLASLVEGIIRNLAD